MSDLIRLKSRRDAPKRIFFDARELRQLVSLYSSRVISGEWRDYAIDHNEHMAVFSIFRHTHETPLFSIGKSQRKGQPKPVFVLFQGPRKLASSASLSDVLPKFEKLPRLVSG